MTQKDFFSQKLKSLETELGESSLLIVSKNRSADEIQDYYDIGHRDFGENRVQELLEKSLVLAKKCPDIRWHMIGPVQTNKINSLFKIPNLFAIHSVHDPQLIHKMIALEDKLGHDVEMYLQVNTSKEEQKRGFETYADLLSGAELILKSKKLKLAGLMTMGAIRTTDFELDAVKCFQELKTMKNKLENDLNIRLKTSMGMSQDYKIALALNSNWVRLGTMMFLPKV